MRKLILSIILISTVSLLHAQNNNDLSITLSADQYKQVEKHFSDKERQNSKSRDWAYYKRYEAANETLKKPIKAVFMGNSITEGWANQHPQFFTSNGFVGRGISGQTTSQMLCRFQSDVIDLKPQLVVIMAGTNDIARNTGYISHKHIVQNIKSMCELAKINKITPILCTILPAYEFGWNKDVNPAEEIKLLNDMIKQYANQNKISFVDYYSHMVDERGGMPSEIAEDGVHPNSKGYDIMEPIVLKAIKKFIKL